jgi:uncharacterized protein
VQFEFDPVKSISNKGKHGIDFVEAQKLWLDPLRLETPVISSTEPRHQLIAKLADKIWSAFITYREENIRIISVRRARDEEKEKYYER